MHAFFSMGRHAMAGLTLVVSLGGALLGCDSAESKTNGCEPGAAVCQCTKQSDCAAGEDCVNNVCAAPSGIQAASGAGGNASTSNTTTSGSGGAAGEASSVTGAGGAGDETSTTDSGSGGTGGKPVSVAGAVVLVLDRSTSAEQDFGDGHSRWEAMLAALVESGGAVEQSADRLALGVLDYTGFNGGTCPDFGDGVAPAADNFETVETYLSDLELPEEKSETPTREAIQQAVEMLSGPVVPKSIVLVTDGITDDTCTDFDNPGCVSQAYYAVQRAYAAGVKTYILGVGDVDAGYLQGVANAGTGQGVLRLPDNGPACGPEAEQPETSDHAGSARFWQAEDREGLSQALGEIFDTLLGD